MADLGKWVMRGKSLNGEGCGRVLAHPCAWGMGWDGMHDPCAERKFIVLELFVEHYNK